MTGRIISTVLLWSLVAGTLYYFGEVAGVLLLGAFSCLAQFEFYTILSKLATRRPYVIAGLALGAGIVLGSYWVADWTTVLAIAMVAAYLILRLAPKPLRRVIAPTLLGLAIPLMLQFLVLSLRSFETLLVPVWLIAVSKFVDVGALLGGLAFGKTKLAPKISPGKTVEGAICGWALGMLVGVGIFEFLNLQEFGLHLNQILLAAVAMGPAAAGGDLLESWLKRKAGVKDSGNLLPGIGGILDLLDSLFLAVPVGYVMLMLAG